MLFKLIKKLLFFGVLAVLIPVLVLAVQFYRFESQEINLPSDGTIFSIKQGSHIKSIAQQLGTENIIDSPWLFILLAKLKGVETQVKAGEYSLRTGLSPTELLDVFTRGNSIQYSFTVIEGWTFRQMIDEMEKHPVIVTTLKGKSNAEIMTALGYDNQHPEGMFFPDTYRFPKGTTDRDFLRRSYQLMEKHLSREWKTRAKNLPFKSSYEALTLASIIEKETGAAYERPMIAAVFIRRLNKKMRLQTDPTIIYGLGESFDGNIRSRDLKKDTPYNTYVHKGLTPTPIALPGLDAIKAALHPADGKALYFVSKGDGSHQFSETLVEHNKAVVKYQLKGRKKR